MIADLIKQLGIDETLWIQLGLFIAFYCWIRFVFFPPFLRLMEARQAKTTDLATESESLTAQVVSKENELAQKLSEVRKEASQEREKVLADAKAAAHIQLDRARKEAKKKIEDARVRASGELASEMVGLKQQAHDISDLFVDKLTKEGARA